MVFIYGHLLIPWFMYYAFLRFDLLRAFFGSFVKTFLVDRLLKFHLLRLLWCFLQMGVYGMDRHITNHLTNYENILCLSRITLVKLPK